MKTLITGILFLLCITVANAQSLGKQVSDAKFQIVKKTAEFLSTDKASFGNKPKNKCDDCKAYEDVEKYALDNKLTNVNTLVGDLKNIKVDTSLNTWKTSLTSFKDNVVDKITTGSDKKTERRKLLGYQGYINNLNAIIGTIKTTGAEPATAIINDTQAAAQKPELTTTKVGDTAKKMDAQPQVMPEEETVPQSSLLNKIMLWLPYIISAILLLLLLIVWSSGNENKKKLSTLQRDKKGLENELAYLKKNNTDALLAIKKLEEEIKNKEIDLQATEARLANLENRKKTTEQSSVSELPVPEKPAAKISVQKPKPVIATIKYARYADMGDGFSNTELLDKADGETIFELTLMPNNNTGEFKVANHNAAQHYALSNAQYFLGKTCQYNSFPSENASIQTDTPGIIKLNGNKWTIVNPAKISFS